MSILGIDLKATLDLLQSGRSATKPNHRPSVLKRSRVLYANNLEEDDQVQIGFPTMLQSAQMRF